MTKKDWPAKRKLRTRSHVIAEMSVNFLERKVLTRGHQLFRMPQPEYGTDAIMFHFTPPDGAFENGQVQFQAKATDNLKLTHKGETISVVVNEGNLHHWCREVEHPFILIVYDAARQRGYWLDVQAYVDDHLIYPKGNTVALRVPIRNKLTVNAVDRFRQMSLSRMKRFS